MTANTLALILLRLLAINLLLNAIAVITSRYTMIMAMDYTSEAGGDDYKNMIIWGSASILLTKFFLSILLLRYSRKIANLITSDNKETLENHPQLPAVLTHVGIVIIGISVFAHSLPRFLSTSVIWFQAQVNLPEKMAGQHNGAMAEVTLLFILALLLILRGKTLTRWIFRFSK